MNTRSFRSYSLTFVMLGAVIVGCDNASPVDEEKPLPTYTVISVPVAIEDVTISDRRDRVDVNLNDHFAHVDGKPMSFSLAVSTGAFASVTLDPVHQLLQIEPIASGSVVVTVNAKDARGYSETTQFNVITDLDPCPRKPSHEEIDFLQFQLGDRWVFSYDYRLVSPTTRDIEGTLTWDVIEADECLNGVSTYVLSSTLEGTVEEFDIVTGGSTWQLREEETFTVVVEETVNLHPFFSDPIERIRPASSPDTLSLSGKASGDWVTLQLSRDAGVAGRSKWLHFSANGDIWETITLISRESN